MVNVEPVGKDDASVGGRRQRVIVPVRAADIDGAVIFFAAQQYRAPLHFRFRLFHFEVDGFRVEQVVCRHALEVNGVHFKRIAFRIHIIPLAVYLYFLSYPVLAAAEEQVVILNVPVLLALDH